MGKLLGSSTAINREQHQVEQHQLRFSLLIMAILNQYGNSVSSQNFIQSSSRGSRSVPYVPNFARDLDAMFTPMDWRTTLSASRSVVANNGAIKGAIVQKADAAVGRAWLPEFQGEDSEWGKIAKDWLKSWYSVCDVRGNLYDFQASLWLDSKAIDEDGGTFVLLTEAKSGYPQIQHIPAHRIGTRDYKPTVQTGKYRGLRIRNGVIENKAGAPVAYNLLGDEPKYDKQIDAQNIIPIADPEYHNQSRGMPALSHGINEIRKAAKSKDYEQMAQMMMSSYGLIEYNESGGADMDAANSLVTEDANGENVVVSEMAEGMVKYFKSNSGGKLESIDSNRPGSDWSDFQDRIMREVIGPVWPYELTWKKDGINGTTIRNIQATARMKVEKRQDVLRGPAKRMVSWAIAKAVKIGQLPPSQDWYRWDFTMPPKVSIDPGRDSKALIEEYKIGSVNMTEIMQEMGKTYENVVTQRAVEIATRKRIQREVEAATGEQIDDREMQMLTPNEMAPSGDDEQPTTQENE
tara:strand:- start:2476 stop:4035 length:1560 start_codon:yes stop_codon:yes gene_type:complete